MDGEHDGLVRGGVMDVDNEEAMANRDGECCAFV